MLWEEKTWSVLGEPGIRTLVAAFYRQIRQDPLIGPMYPPDDWEGSERRLADFFLFRIGGDSSYLETRGHPRLRMRHAPFSIGIAERDRWLELMDRAMDETKVPDEIRPALSDFFVQVADFMRNRPEPDGR